MGSGREGNAAICFSSFGDVFSQNLIFFFSGVAVSRDGRAVLPPTPDEDMVSGNRAGATAGLESCGKLFAGVASVGVGTGAANATSSTRRVSRMRARSKPAM